MARFEFEFSIYSRRKRFEGRRTAPLYSRKDSGSYGTSKRNSANSGGGKSSGGGNKENDKYAVEAATDGGFGKGTYSFYFTN